MSTSNTPPEDYFDRLKRISAEKGAASIANRDAAIARSEDSAHDKPDSFRKVRDNPANVAPFASDSEMTAAMRDPRYRTDAGYRASVVQRINAGLPNTEDASETPESTHQRDLTDVQWYSVRSSDSDVPAGHAVFDVQPFATRAEVNAAFKDPRYARDGAYRALVAAKLDITDNQKLL